MIVVSVICGTFDLKTENEVILKYKLQKKTTSTLFFPFIFKKPLLLLLEII